MKLQARTSLENPHMRLTGVTSSKWLTFGGFVISFKMVIKSVWNRHTRAGRDIQKAWGVTSRKKPLVALLLCLFSCSILASGLGFEFGFGKNFIKLFCFYLFSIFYWYFFMEIGGDHTRHTIDLSATKWLDFFQDWRSRWNQSRIRLRLSIWKLCVLGDWTQTNKSWWQWHDPVEMVDTLVVYDKQPYLTITVEFRPTQISAISIQLPNASDHSHFHRISIKT